MNKIGFKNFRRFQNFDPLEYSGITFLVGRNNSGKSTLVKALLLIDTYFKSGQIKSFSFSGNVLEDANIVTYGRAKNYQAQENYIHFTLKIENYQIELNVTGEDDKAFASVHSLSITDLVNNLSFVFDVQNKFVTVFKKQETKINSVVTNLIPKLVEQISEIKKQLEESGLKKTSKEYIELISKKENLEAKLTEVNKVYNSLVTTNEVLFSLNEDFVDVNSLTEIVEGFLNHSMSQYEREFIDVQKGKKASEKFKDLRALKELGTVFIESSFSYFINLMNDFSIVYMGANPAKQSALFAIRDKNNALAQAIYEYEQLNILEGEEVHRFVIKWMKIFEVGDDFTILMHAGEAYEMKIHSNNANIHLADKGMGSIQAMLLLMRMACVIKKKILADKNSNDIRIEVETGLEQNKLVNRFTLIMEEPELNLHPALQSKLADLFLDVHQRFNIDFLIETHSEYILRRSQVIVAENEFEVPPNENPFYVHYFPKDINQTPYRLEYQKDGSFNRNFGVGFFDEASSSTLDLLKLKRQNKV
jgi:predicted ATP-dependent endonuclease of OLD family